MAVAATMVFDVYDDLRFVVDDYREAGRRMLHHFGGRGKDERTGPGTDADA